MRASRRIALAAALASLALGSAAADEPAIAPFTLAVVRLDGVLTPFATWNGRAWTNTWPTPDKEVDTPIRIEETAKEWWGKPGPTSTWQVWRPDGSSSEARVTTPTWYLAHCQQGLGLRTSLQTPPAPPARVQPYPKLGLAASRKIDVRAIERVDPAGPLAAAVVKAITAQVNDDETGEAKRYLLDGWQHPYTDSERLDVPIRVEALYRTPLNGGQFAYYFEAVKQYPIRSREGIEQTGAGGAPLRPKTCEVVTAIAGWFTAGATPTTVKPRLLRVRPTSCDYESVDVMLPLGYLVMNDSAIWVAQFSGWGRERYGLLDPLAKAWNEVSFWWVSGGSCEP